MEVMKVLDEIEELVDGSGRVPLTGKVIIEAEALLDRVDRIRSLLPEELRQAQWVSKERDRILNDAQKEAEELLSKTHLEVKNLAQETEVVKEANTQAGNIIMEAQQKALEIEEGANSYAFDVLKSLEDNLSKILNIVKKGQEELKREETNV
ncbi:MAG TPA: ATPase [Clostridia bacterium]|nr:ATPase [Clostridia bacterium]